MFERVQPGKGPFIDLFRRNNAIAEMSELPKLVLDCLQPFTPLSAGDLGRCIIVGCTPKLAVQYLNVSDLLSETPDLVP